MKTALLAVLLFSLALASQPASHAASPAATTIDSQLEATLKKANQAYIQAARSNDPAKLSPYFSGQVLTALAQSFEAFRGQDLYAVSELQGFSWRKVSQRDGSARAETTEKWKNTYYKASTGKCAFVVPAHELRQTYSLEKRGGGWTITQIVDDPNNKRPKPTPCPR